MSLLRVIANDHLGRKSTLRFDIGLNLRLLRVRVECSPDDTVGDLKKPIPARTGTGAFKITSEKRYAYKIFDIHRIMTHLVELLHRYAAYKDQIANYKTLGRMSLGI